MVNYKIEVTDRVNTKHAWGIDPHYPHTHEADKNEFFTVYSTKTNQDGTKTSKEIYFDSTLVKNFCKISNLFEGKSNEDEINAYPPKIEAPNGKTYYYTYGYTTSTDDGYNKVIPTDFIGEDNASKFTDLKCSIIQLKNTNSAGTGLTISYYLVVSQQSLSGGITGCIISLECDSEGNYTCTVEDYTTEEELRTTQLGRGVKWFKIGFMPFRASCPVECVDGTLATEDSGVAFFIYTNTGSGEGPILFKRAYGQPGATVTWSSSRYPFRLGYIRRCFAEGRKGTNFQN